jgi:hypothetical protein
VAFLDLNHILYDVNSLMWSITPFGAYDLRLLLHHGV